jgi:hypothetical protein
LMASGTKFLRKYFHHRFHATDVWPERAGIN